MPGIILIQAEQWKEGNAITAVADKNLFPKHFTVLTVL